MAAIEFYQYLIHFAVMMTILTSMAVYLLVSKRNAFGSEIVTDQRLRRKAGRLIFIYTLIYLTNIPMVLWLADYCISCSNCCKTAGTGTTGCC